MWSVPLLHLNHIIMDTIELLYILHFQNIIIFWLTEKITDIRFLRNQWLLLK